MILKIDNEIDRRYVQREGDNFKDHLKKSFAREFGKRMIDKFELKEEEMSDPFKVNFHVELVVLSKEELTSILNDLKSLRQMGNPFPILDRIKEKLIS